MAKVTKREEMEMIIEDIKSSGFEEVPFTNGTFYIEDKNDYSFHIFFVYNEKEFQNPTYDEIVYNLKDRIYSISRNQKELAFSNENLKKSFGKLRADQLSFLEVPGNAGFYQKTFSHISAIDYETSKMVSRFLVRLIEEYPVLERVHKMGFDIDKVFTDIRNYKTNSVLEAFNFENKLQLKFYKMQFELDFEAVRNIYNPNDERLTSAQFIRNLSQQQLEFIVQVKDLCLNLDKKYGLKKTIAILELMTSTYSNFDDTYFGIAMNVLEKCGRGNLDKKRFIEYIGYEVDVRQGIVNPRKALNTYVDYIKMTKNISTKFEPYPKSLIMKHDLALKYSSVIDNTEIKEKFKKSTEVVKHLEGNINKTDWSIVVPCEPADLVDEGEQLSHCVKSYIETVANGDCQIVFLRRTKDINTSVYTVEIRKDAIVQFAGYGNVAPEKDAKDAIHKLAEAYNLIESYE